MAQKNNALRDYQRSVLSIVQMAQKISQSTLGNEKELSIVQMAQKYIQ